MKRFLLFFSLISIITPVFAQPTQTIRGTVSDGASGNPIPFASVVILNSDPIIGTTTDTLGNFSLQDVAIGRYDLQITSEGYEKAIFREINVISGKQSFLTVNLIEMVTELNVITIKPRVNKEQPLNQMATVSAKMLSVEEAKRYAGGFDDPARLATATAGVGGNTGDNGIIVRGNAPKFLQWKMEGVEIPNPNHFGDLLAVGGGLITALSSQMLANSDFFTGAFPAEYNNALSGIFDISMRTGNNQRRERTFQVGIIGLDASLEGPFKKGGRASYLFNYRYSTLGLLAPVLPDGAGGIKYQDVSFKLNFPTKKAGIITVWGLGFIDGATAEPKMDSTLWEFADDNERNSITQYTGVVGLSHKYFFKNNAYLKTTFATTANTVEWKTEKLNSNYDLTPFSRISNTNWNLILSSFINKKFSARHTNKTGILVTGMLYDIWLNKASAVGLAPQEIIKTTGNSTLLSAYSSSSYSITPRLVMNVGVNSQLFTLNNRFTVEPRFGMRQKMGARHSIAAAYGLHSRLEKLNYYLNNSLSTGEKEVNKQLDFSKAHHFIIGYDWNISEFIHLKIEPYLQLLYSIPVIKDSSFSFMNLQNDLFFSEKLQNTGKGRNYGIDLTFEKYITNGYYYLFTASVFNAEYKGGDNQWYKTRYNRNYVFNFLIGKEWQMGKTNQNTLSLNTRFTYQGGNRYSPINQVASMNAQEVIFDETRAFTQQAPPVLNVHFTASYKINKQRSSHEFALKILNVNGQPDFRGYQFNYLTNTVEKDLAKVVIPNLSYKIEF